MYALLVPIVINRLRGTFLCSMNMTSIMKGDFSYGFDISFIINNVLSNGIQGSKKRNFNM